MSDYRALYRKWRPVDFDDVSGQAAITDILKYEVANNKLSHAYLFSGSRGTGKTSCAKILAKAVNCLDPVNGNPCNKCAACLAIDRGNATDVIEMDAASNNGVDNVRDMKDEIAFTPAELKYRVYIIDEVHMMSPSAFNALLKTLEEPPTYVIFILATTEYHKLPTTIVSRCQRFDFRRISTEDIMARLKMISDAEGITLTDDGARVIARVARGGMRDAVSLLELCAGQRCAIDAELVFETVGSGNRDAAYSLIRAICASDFTAVYKRIAAVVEKSGDVSVFWQELIDAYRDVMIVRHTDEAKNYLDLTEVEYAELSEIAKEFTTSKLIYHTSILESAMADMQRAFNSKRSIAEIALTRMCDSTSVATPEALALRIEELEREVSLLKMGVPVSDVSADAITVLPAKKEAPKRTARETVEVEPQPTPEVVKPESASTPAETPEAPAPVQPVPEKKNDTTVLYRGWKGVLARIGEVKPSLSVQFVNSRAYITPDGTYLVCMNAFFANMLATNDKNLATIRSVIAARENKKIEEIKIAIEPLDSTRAEDLYREIQDEIDESN